MAPLAKKWTKLSEKLDGPIAVISPRAAARRQAHRFAYDAIDRTRTRKKRKVQEGTGDVQLTAQRLSDLREIARDMGRNNPLAVGILQIERNGVVGSGPKVQCRTDDDGWNTEAEALWQEYMIKRPVDITGRYNINRYVRKAYLSYRRDGDFLTAFLDNGLLAAEGDQIGTPFGKSAKKANHFDIINGVAYSKRTGRVIGYYVGKPNKWGYIAQKSYRKYATGRVHFWFNSERFSQSRGEPILTASIDTIDKICDYMDAELVAAKVNACFTMFISKNDSYGDGLPPAYTEGVNPSGKDADGNQVEKMEVGTILYGETGEAATGIGMTRPGGQFDPFVKRNLAIGFRPMCMPLMLVLGDFSGATFMNMRGAYTEVRELWQVEQDDIVKPFMWHSHRVFIDNMVAEKKLIDRKDKYAVEILCRRWPYVDPFKESKADEQQIKNRTTNRTIICSRQGLEWAEVEKTRVTEEKTLKDTGQIVEPEKKPVGAEPAVTK